MITKQDIIRAAKQIVRKNKGYHVPALIHPQRDWALGLGIFTIVVLGGSFYLASLFVTYQKLDRLEGAPVTGIARYRDEVVKDVLAYYAERADAYTQWWDPTAPEVVPMSEADPAAATSTATSTPENAISTSTPLES